MLVVFGGLAAIIVFLALCVLGAMRETVLLRGEVKALGDLVRHPPPPSFVGQRMPLALREVIPTRLRSDRRMLVAFVSPGCAPCERLITGLNDAIERHRMFSEDVLLIVWAASESQAAGFGADLPVTRIVDDGSLSRACEIRATPTELVISPDEGTVIDYNLEGDLAWVLSQMTAPATPVRI